MPVKYIRRDSAEPIGRNWHHEEANESPNKNYNAYQSSYHFQLRWNSLFAIRIGARG